MWHLSINIFDMFDPTPPHTLDKIMAKLVSIKQSQSLTLSPKVKVIAKIKRYQPEVQKNASP